LRYVIIEGCEEEAEWVEEPVVLHTSLCRLSGILQSKMKPIAPTLILSEKNIVVTQDEYTSALCAQ
jgi:hypothetical protein